MDEFLTFNFVNNPHILNDTTVTNLMDDEREWERCKHE